MREHIELFVSIKVQEERYCKYMLAQGLEPWFNYATKL